MAMELGYLGIEVSDLPAWNHYCLMHGLMSAGTSEDGALVFRNDDHASRFRLLPGSSDDISYVGWLTDSQTEYDAIRHRLAERGLAFSDGTRIEAAARDVEKFYRFHEPNGIEFEVAMGAKLAATPFQSPYIPDGFLTGTEGLGHLVVVTDRYEASERFMREIMDGKVTDYIIQPLTPEVDGKIGFIRLNTRHHSIGYAEGFQMPRKMHHFMLQVPGINEVGTTYDRVRKAGIHMNQTIGQHPNDKMVSFYSETPSGFYVEFGALGISIPDEHGEPGHVFDKFSTWGHEFQTKQNSVSA